MKPRHMYLVLAVAAVALLIWFGSSRVSRIAPRGAEPRSTANAVPSHRSGMEPAAPPGPEKAPGASEGARREAAEAAVAAFTGWLTEWRRADAAAQAGLAERGLQLATARREALKELIPQDPRRALELAVPMGLRRELPPEVQSKLEHRIDGRGDLEVTIGCFGTETRIERSALIAGRRYEVHVYGRRAEQHTKFGVPLHGIAVDEVAALAEEPYRLLDDAERQASGLGESDVGVFAGDGLRVFGSPAELEAFAARQVAAEAVVGPHVASVGGDGSGSGAGVPPTAANTPWILGAKRVLWVQIDFADDPGGVATPAEIEVTNARVSEFYAAVSQGKTTMSFTVLPQVLRMTRDKSFYNASSSTVSQLQTDAGVLARAYDVANGNNGTYNPDRYDRWIVLFKRMPAYSFGGQAQLTGPQVRMNGNISPGTTYHELGHTQGLSHSHYWLPSGSTGIGAGTHVEYGDVFDAMGSSGSSSNNHFNAAQKAKIGYLEAEAITTVSQAGTYRVARHDHQDAAGIRALKIAPEGLGYEYWVDYRRFGPTSFSAAQLDRLRNGFHLHWGQGKAPKYTSGAGTYLIDATAGSAGGASDAPFRTGEAFVDADAGVAIKPLATGGATPAEYIEVQVSFGAVDGNRNPVLQADLPAGTLAARTNVIFRASATDPDGDPVYYRWDFGDGQINPNFDNLTRRFTKGGRYSLRVSAHDGRGGIAVKNLDFTVADPLVSWTRRAEGLTTSALYDVLYAAGKFVIVGSGSTVLTSPDGLTWAKATFPASIGLTALVHNGSRFLAVGNRSTTSTDRGVAAVSLDGETWTTTTIATGSALLWAAAHGSGRFVAVGDAGAIHTSTDGATWAAATSGVRDVLRSVSFANGLFVVTGDNGRVLTSTDGLNWLNRSLPTTASFWGSAWHHGAWYTRSGTTTYRSVDGVDWARVASSGASSLGSYRVHSIGGVLLAGLTSGTVDLSENAQAWAGVQLDATTGAGVRSIGEGQGVIVAVGNLGQVYTATAPVTSGASTLIAAPTLRNEADSLKVDVGRKNVLAAGGSGFAKLELYANGAKVSELSGTAGALAWTPTALGSYSLVVRGVTATGESVVSAAVPAVAGFSRWTWRNPLPVGNDLRGAVRVGGKWWIVGGSGAFLTLDGAGSVTTLDFPTTQNLTAIAYGNGRFVAAGPYYDAGAREEIGSLWTSTDGYAWTPLLTTVFDSFTLNFVAFSGDQWLAGSTGGLLLTSTDGINWARQLSGVTTSIKAAAYGGGTWVVVGAGGRALTSRDGVAWTSHATGVTTDLNGIAFREGMFTAVGAAGVILVSGDGITWARQNSGTTGTLNAVGYVKGTWVAAGDAGLVRTSANLTNWSAASLGDRTSSLLFVGGSGNDGLLLGRAGEIYTSSDPATWTRVTQGTGETKLAVTYAGDRFVAVGATTDPIGRGTNMPVMISSDGATWTRALGNSVFTQSNVSLNAVTYGQGTYVTVSSAGRIFTSSDANTWTQRTSPTTSSLNALAASATGFVAAGAAGTVLSSVDGTSWTTRSSGVTTILRGVTHGGGRYVVVGDSGVVLHSPDGETWTRATSGTTANLLCVGWWEDVGFLAAGNSGTMLNSTDGATWQPVETGVADGITAILRTPVGFVASAGLSGALLVSFDGASWATATLPADRTIRGLAASASAIVAVGDNGTLLTFEFRDTTPAPAILAQPVSQTAGSGNSVVLSVDARNVSGAVYQWAKDGTPIAGANSPTYLIPSLNPARAGSYTVTITTPTGTATSAPAVVAVGVPADPGRLVNLSIRTDLSSATDSFIFGVVVGGAGTSGTKPLLIRAAGPSLSPFGVQNVLQDPKLEFFNGAARVGENDNWGGGAALTTAMAQVGAFPFSAPTSRDAAIFLPDLASGSNSARISGNGAGAVIAELYDATPQGGFTASTPRLVNVSVLKHIGTGMIAGFVVGGSSARNVLIRAVGPTLGAAPFGVADVVADPQLALFSGQNQVSANDNWGGTAALSAAFAQVGAFALPPGSRDAALLVTLQPGSYTVQVSGVGGATGVALVEIYEVP
ncbi:MAG: PKD domain-containing protein [Verrucomicrobia bacterium]|nr:PKD domain-containing protein [Verrucomicrobiota bacterium]